MKTKIYIGFASLFLLAAIFIAGCKKDPYDGVVSNEKSIEAFSIGKGFVQIGPAVVDRQFRTVKVKVLMEQNTNLSAVSPIVQTSYKAVSSPASGQTVNFAAANNKLNYTVTSESGESQEWTVEIEPFTETILGTYNITALTVYGGTGAEYGGDAVLKMTDKPWLWPADGTGPEAELDNLLTFEFTGTNADGSTYGKFTNSAGANGKYANFQYVAAPAKDVNSFYRVMPAGEGIWTRNYSNNTVTFTFANGSKAVSTFKNSGTVTITASKNKVITNQAFEFTLVGGKEEWNDAATKIYTDYDKFAGNPKKFWIDVTKK